MGWDLVWRGDKPRFHKSFEFFRLEMVYSDAYKFTITIIITITIFDAQCV